VQIHLIIYLENQDESHIKVDILTPAYSFPATLAIAEIHLQCQKSLGAETELEFFPLNGGGRIACLMKKSSKYFISDHCRFERMHIVNFVQDLIWNLWSQL
jgi:hypothetical protein